MNIIVTDYFETRGTLKAFKTARQALRYAYLREQSTGERLKVINKVTKRVYTQNDVNHAETHKHAHKAVKMDYMAHKAYKNRKRLAESHDLIEKNIRDGKYKPKGRPLQTRIERIVTISDKAVTTMAGRRGKVKAFEHKNVTGFAKESRYYVNVQDYIERKQKGLTNV